MIERPILFSAPMVRAIRAGRKTQTRRLMKPQPGPTFWDHAGYVLKVDGEVMRFWDIEAGAFSPHSPIVKCPYGVPGDRLWVKETHLRSGDEVMYADDEDFDICYPTRGGKLNLWRVVSSIHMPRAASRILLEVVSVRAERVQAISEADAIAEGMIFTKREPYVAGQVGPIGGPLKDYHRQPEQWAWKENASADESLHTAALAFQNLWIELHGWDSLTANPWVRVVEFKVIGGAA